MKSLTHDQMTQLPQGTLFICPDLGEGVYTKGVSYAPKAHEKGRWDFDYIDDAGDTFGTKQCYYDSYKVFDEADLKRMHQAAMKKIGQIAEALPCPLKTPFILNILQNETHKHPDEYLSMLTVKLCERMGYQVNIILPTKLWPGYKFFMGDPAMRRVISDASFGCVIYPDLATIIQSILRTMDNDIKNASAIEEIRKAASAPIVDRYAPKF